MSPPLPQVKPLPHFKAVLCTAQIIIPIIVTAFAELLAHQARSCFIRISHWAFSAVLEAGAIVIPILQL